MERKHTDSDNFSDTLRRIRREKGYTQQQLADISGVSRRAIVHYENYGKRPTFEKIKKLSDALGTTDAELLGTIKAKKETAKKDISYKIMRKARLIEQLPPHEQTMILNMIDSLAEKYKLK